MIASRYVNRRYLKDTVFRDGSVSVRLALLGLMALAVAAPAAAGCDDDERPPAPHSLKANPLGSGGIMLQWSSNAGHYDIQIRDEKGRPVREAPDIVGGATNENYHEFYGLDPDKEYFFTIRARTEGGTQGCISKNPSETVHARTDSADLNQSCRYYAQTAMEDIQKMRKQLCEIPGDRFSGIWAEREGTQFEYCLEQRRAGLHGDANAQWLRNQDLWACEGHANKCLVYEYDAVAAARTNKILGCGYKGPLWTSDGHAHYSRCMRFDTNSAIPRKETRKRRNLLTVCRLKKARAAQASAGQTSGPQTPGPQTSGGDATCPGVPEEWAKMLKAHNDERAKYCGTALTWDCNLAAAAQSYATQCILNVHGSNAENMADEWNSDDSYPAVADDKAFEDVWGCERDNYDFTTPELVLGFKGPDCHKGKDGGKPVNGHFTQIVWRTNTAVGCGRAKCTMTDNQGKVHQGTHWVCRYSPGGNDSSKLAQNVQKAPACTQSFHSRSVSCLRGMVPTDDGSCACPPGTQWDGRACAEPPRAQSPARIPPVQPPVTRPVCPVDLPVGTPPDCCPANHHFDPTVNRPRGSCVADTATSTPPSKRVDTQQSTSRPPPSCPAGTHFEHTLKHRAGACVTNTGTGGATTSKGADTQPNTPRPPATPCPAGTRFGRTLRHPRGACVTDTGTGGATTSKGCPVGTHFARTPTHPGGACVSDTGNGSTQGPTPKPTPTPTPNPAPTPPPTPTPSPKCTGGRIGTPPNCFCPPRTKLMGGRCRFIPKPTPTPTGPAPHPTCPPGTKPPNCSPIVK